MSENPFEDLPDELKKIVYEIMNKIKDFDLSKLEELFSELLNSEDMNKLTDLMKDGKFNPFMMNLGNIQGLEKFMQKMQNPKSTDENPIVEFETPYFEIVDKDDTEGEIIVDLPGILDIRHINWTQNQNTIELSAENDEYKYQIDIILPDHITIISPLAELKNTVYILPYKKKEE